MNQPIEPIDKSQRPDIFSRRALELTFQLLRNYRPSLALVVQNVLAKGHIAQSSLHPYQQNSATEHFVIDLEAHTIGKIVATLTDLGHAVLSKKDQKRNQTNNSNRHSEAGNLVVLRTLMRKWINLAEWLVLQAEPVPRLESPQGPSLYH